MKCEAWTCVALRLQSAKLSSNWYTDFLSIKCSSRRRFTRRFAPLHWPRLKRDSIGANCAYTISTRKAGTTVFFWEPKGGPLSKGYELDSSNSCWPEYFAPRKGLHVWRYHAVQRQSFT